MSIPDPFSTWSYRPGPWLERAPSMHFRRGACYVFPCRRSSGFRRSGAARERMAEQRREKADARVVFRGVRGGSGLRTRDQPDRHRNGQCPVQHVDNEPATPAPRRGICQTDRVRAAAGQQPVHPRPGHRHQRRRNDPRDHRRQSGDERCSIPQTGFPRRHIARANDRKVETAQPVAEGRRDRRVRASGDQPAWRDRRDLPARRLDEMPFDGGVMRSLLFVPADSERKLARAPQSGADALILDLEDSVVPANRPLARGQARDFLDSTGSADFRRYIRINPLSSGIALEDLVAVVPGRPDGILLPKCAPEDLRTVDHYLSALERASDLSAGGIRVIAIAIETPAAMFALGGYRGASSRLEALTWGAEDLAACIGGNISMASMTMSTGWRGRSASWRRRMPVSSRSTRSIPISRTRPGSRPSALPRGVPALPPKWRSIRRRSQLLTKPLRSMRRSLPGRARSSKHLPTIPTPGPSPSTAR